MAKLTPWPVWEKFMRYVVLVPSSSPHSAPQLGGSGAGAAVKLAAKTLKWLHDFGFERRVRKEVESPRIQEAVSNGLQTGAGCLLEVYYFEWKVPDFNGFKAKNLVNVYFVGAGDDYVALYDAHTSTARMYPGPPNGWVSRRFFLWATEAVDQRRHHDPNADTIDNICLAQ